MRNSKKKKKITYAGMQGRKMNSGKGLVQIQRVSIKYQVQNEFLCSNSSERTRQEREKEEKGNRNT